MLERRVEETTGEVGNGGEGDPVSQCLWGDECSGRETGITGLLRPVFIWGLTQCFIVLKVGKKNKNTRHYNPKMFLSVLIFQYLALHKCATLLIQLLNKGWAGNPSGQMPIWCFLLP